MRTINADKLKEALKSGCECCSDANTNWCEHCCKINDFEDLIDNAPTVNKFYDYNEGYKDGFSLGFKRGSELNERPQGEWIFVSRHCWKCPYCQELTNEGKNFCHNCGADMRGEK